MGLQERLISLMANLALTFVAQSSACLSHQLQASIAIVGSMAYNSARVKSGTSAYCNRVTLGCMLNKL
jgi:hypothetical protein